MKRMPMKPELVRATREGRKKETRRIITPQPKHTPILCEVGITLGADPSKDGNEWVDADCVNPGVKMRGPAYLPGEIVGITEEWRAPVECDSLSGSDLVKGGYPIDEIQFASIEYERPHTGRRRLARFLPDAYVKTRVLILAVTAERVQWITETQAKDEGVPSQYREYENRTIGAHRCYSFGFANTWDKLHPDWPWKANPWVWRYCFELAP